MTHQHKSSSFSLLATIALLALGGSLVYAFVQISTLKENVVSLNTELASTTATLAQNTQNFVELRNQTLGISNSLSNAQQNIDAVKNQVGGVEQTVGSISSTVGTIQKLAEIDSELLKKYSKITFLNENYVPAHLFVIPSDYLYSSLRSERFVVEAWPHLKQLLDAAKASGVTLYVKSGYRSFSEQQQLKSTYTFIYGVGTANSFSADQGYSEHQLGTTVDFITSGMNGQLDGFDKTKSYEWLVNNAYRFGFELSYPKGNGYFVFEPWHWRFIGVKLATYLHNNKVTFYDTDQRNIDTYLINIFE